MVVMSINKDQVKGRIEDAEGLQRTIADTIEVQNTVNTSCARQNPDTLRTLRFVRVPRLYGAYCSDSPRNQAKAFPVADRH